MLHILNKAWVNILARHAGQLILFVYTNQKESEMIIDTFSAVYQEVDKDDDKLCNMWVISEQDLKTYIELCKLGYAEFEMCDDILISHNIYDMMLKDFLSKHCKRKCC